MKNEEKTEMTPFAFDTRMVEWNLKHDVITKDQLEKYLKSLPDESAGAEALHIDDESTRTEQA